MTDTTQQTPGATALPPHVTERLIPALAGRVQARVLVAGMASRCCSCTAPAGCSGTRSWRRWPRGTPCTRSNIRARNTESLEHLPGIWELVLFYDEILDELGLERVAVVGHSFGAWSVRSWREQP